MTKEFFKMENSDFENEEESLEEDFEQEDFEKIVDELEKEEEDEQSEIEQDEEENQEIKEQEIKADQMKKIIEAQLSLDTLLLQTMKMVNKSNTCPVQNSFLNLRKVNRSKVETAKLNYMNLLKELLELTENLQKQFGQNFSGIRESIAFIDNLKEVTFRFENKANEKTKLNNTHKLDQLEQTIDSCLSEILNHYKKSSQLELAKIKQQMGGSSLLLKNPFQEGNDLKNQSWISLQKMFQMKNGQYKIIGSQDQNLDKPNTEIYEDPQLINGIYNDYMFFVNKFQDQMKDGIIFRNTENYLMKRKKKIAKEIDRRATKSRKLRFIPIKELQNFMSSKNNEKVIDNRDQLLQSLFGRQIVSEKIYQPDDIELLQLIMIRKLQKFNFIKKNEVYLCINFTLIILKPRAQKKLLVASEVY